MKEKKPYIIEIIAENRPSGLQRISSIFLRGNINVETLVMEKVENKDLLNFSIKITMGREKIKKIILQMKKIVEIKKIKLKS